MSPRDESEVTATDLIAIDFGLAGLAQSKEETKILGIESGFAHGSTNGMDTNGLLHERTHDKRGSEKCAATFAVGTIEDDRLQSRSIHKLPAYPLARKITYSNILIA